MSNVQAGYGKISLDKIAGLSTREFNFNQPLPAEPTYLWMKSTLQFDFLFYPKPGADRMFVLFCGDADRKRYSLPVFQRWKWAERFPGHCLFVSDPTLHLHHELGLAWYCGTADFDPLNAIADVVTDLAKAADIPESRIILYGSSGGGFAALRLAAQLKQSNAIVINPQINILEFSNQRKVDFCLNICFPNMDREGIVKNLDARVNLLSHSYDFRGRSIVYAQNSLDKSHYLRHYMPFLEKLGVNGRKEFASAELNTILFKNEDGHPKAEAGNPEVFDRMIELALQM